MLVWYYCTNVPRRLELYTSALRRTAYRQVNLSSTVRESQTDGFTRLQGQPARHASVDCGNEATCLLDLSLLVR